MPVQEYNQLKIYLKLDKQSFLEVEKFKKDSLISTKQLVFDYILFINNNIKFNKYFGKIVS